MASEPSRDEQTVTPEGESIQRLPEGVIFRDAVTHVDARGTVTELFDQRWDWHEDPLVFTYAFTIKPGMIKGWGSFPMAGGPPPPAYPPISTCGNSSSRSQSVARRAAPVRP